MGKFFGKRAKAVDIVELAEATPAEADPLPVAPSPPSRFIVCGVSVGSATEGEGPHRRKEITDAAALAVKAALQRVADAIRVIDPTSHEDFGPTVSAELLLNNQLPAFDLAALKVTGPIRASLKDMRRAEMLRAARTTAASVSGAAGRAKSFEDEYVDIGGD